MQELELSVSRARDRAERIRTALNVSWQLVKDAYVDRDWLALGYASWDEYCTGEFSEFRIKLPREERQEVVSSMREIGMSMPAIASATGVSLGTVHGTLSKLKASGELSDEVKVTGTDGKTYTTKPRPEPTTPEWEDVGTIPQSRLKDIARPTAATAIPQNELDELNQHQEETMTTPTKTKGDKTSNYLTEAAERIALMLETLSSIDFTNTTNEAKAAALENLEQATRHLTTIKRHIK